MLIFLELPDQKWRNDPAQWNNEVSELAKVNQHHPIGAIQNLRSRLDW